MNEPTLRSKKRCRNCKAFNTNVSDVPCIDCVKIIGNKFVYENYIEDVDRKEK
jgi:hypothetical protein